MKFIDQQDGTLMADPVEVVPELAESWTVDGPVITFKLRPGVKFYPTGNPMTAEDVRYTFERLVRIVGNGRNQAGIAGLFKAEQVEVVDPMTVKITFTDGSGVPTRDPGGADLDEVPAVRGDQLGRGQEARHRRGSMGQRMDEEEPRHDRALLHREPPLGQQLELKAVPNHWSGKQPPFEDVVLRITGNADLVSLIKGGVVDYAAEGLTGRHTTPWRLPAFRCSMARRRRSCGSHGDGQGAVHRSRVRQAMLYAIPHDRIIKTALAGRGKRQICMFNAEDWTCNNSYDKYKLDLDKAKELLKEAGKTSSPSISGTRRRCPTTATSPSSSPTR